MHTYTCAYIHKIMHTYKHAYIHTDRQRDRQTDNVYIPYIADITCIVYIHALHTLHYVHTYRHVTFPVFAGISVFSIFFAEKSISEIQVKMRRKLSGGGAYYLHCFIKQRRACCLDYLFCINRAKENCLQKLPGVLVSNKDEVICSANYVQRSMFTSCFLLKIRFENRKKAKEKKAYHYLKWRSVPCNCNYLQT